MTRRLLLLGGASGSGKSTTAQLLAKRLGANWLQVDTLWVTAQLVVPKESETYRLLRIDQRIFNTLDPIPEILEHHIACSRYICSWLPRVLDVELLSHETLVADGAWLLPEFVSALELTGVQVTAAYLHESELPEVRQTLDARRFVQKQAPWHGRAAENAWTTGNWLASEATKFGMPVVAARPRDTLVQRVLEATGMR